MRTVLGILRRCVKIVGGIACALSALLLVATVVLWLRSLGHKEGWSFVRFEPRPDWTAPDLAGSGIGRSWSAGAIHGRLWLGSETWAPAPRFQPLAEYRRDPISAADAKQHFDTFFQRGEREWWSGTDRAWRFAGAGLSLWHNPLDLRIGRPSYEGFTLALPFWMLAVVFGIGPGVFLLRIKARRERKRRAAGLCVHCGYDLRATPDPAGPHLARCPDCGREVAGNAHSPDNLPMRPPLGMLGILRRCLKIAGGIACALSALLLVATVVLWLRSLGHSEGWTFERFEPRPDWTAPDLAGLGMSRRWSAGATHGRLLLESWTWAPQPELNPQPNYHRWEISAADAKQQFDTFFQPGERPFAGGTARAWRFAGAGFWQGRAFLDPRIGRPAIVRFTLALPFWMLAVVFGIGPGVFLLRIKARRRRKRRAAGLCVHCGYDLRATPDPAGPRLERCPECGREAVSRM